MGDDRVGPGWWIATLTGGGLIVIALFVLLVWALVSGGPTTHSYTIEAGTGARLDAG